MKHAYLIMGHNNFYNLKILLKLLDDERNDIYVHIDKKVRDFNPKDIADVVKYAHIYIYSELKVNWGGFSQVRCEMFLLKAAHCNFKYAYYHLMSCADLPIKNQEYIHNFFAQHEGYEFVQFKDDQLKMQYTELSRRITLYHILQEYRKCSNLRIVKGALTVSAKILMAIQIIFGVNRLKKKNCIIKYGSQWFSITNEFVEYLIENEKHINHMYRLTMCPDEIFLQTMLYNSSFKSNIYQYKFQQQEYGNMRAIDWERTDDPAHPHIWCMDDFSYLMASDMLYARKFSDSIEPSIIDKICEELRKDHVK